MEVLNTSLSNVNAIIRVFSMPVAMPNLRRLFIYGCALKPEKGAYENFPKIWTFFHSSR